MTDRRLRVVFDAHAITPRRSGIGEYSARLLAAMLTEASEEIEVHAYANGAIRPLRAVEELPAIADGSLYAMNHQRELPRLLRAGDYDLLHMPEFIIPPRVPIPSVVTLYDVIPLAKPEYIAKSLKVRLLPLYRWMMRRATRVARRVLTISEHSKGDIVRMLGADPARIDVTPLAATVEVDAAPLPAALRDRLGGYRYALYVGRHDPYKGLGLLFDAFARVKDADGVRDVCLVVAGARDERYGYAEQLEKLDVRHRVHFLDYVAPGQLSSLYANAEAFIFPSLYEGFGLPPLDAMRHGVPVLCSDRSSLPEVVGDGALTVNPEATEEFASALRRVLTDATLRTTLVERGLARQSRFSWSRTAALTVKCYQRALARPSR